MGCCKSSFLKPSSLHAKKTYSDDISVRRGGKRSNPHHRNNNKDDGDGGCGGGRGWHFSNVPDFSEFSAADLRDATNNFSVNAVVSSCSDQETNVVYRGCLKGDMRRIAVKKFSKSTWPDPKQFAEEARAIGKMRHMRLVNLIGYCCDGDERLLVSEYMPNDTLPKHLFHWEKQTMEWAMRLRAALYVAEALEYCRQSGRKLYHDLNAYRVLFDENGSPRLSCFGWMKHSKDGKNFSTNLAYTPPEYLRSESVVFSFGTFLLDLLSGKHVPPSHAVDTIQKENLLVLIDSHLEGNYPEEEAATVFDLATKCLHNNPKDRPEIKDIISVLATLQHKPDVPSYEMLGISKLENPETESQNSLIYDACHRMDLEALHQILEATDYKDDEVTCELSFQQWAQQIKDVWNTRQQGDSAFRNTDFKSAIEKYTQFIETGIMISPTVYARRSMCHLFCDQPDAALRDAMQAQCVYPEWPTAFYLQAVALAKLNMLQDSANMLKEASILEDKRLVN
ncbi:probable serine/threonine-protein kinase At4g35230 isoform X2 [Eutrema salsugineum]|uniref:probable serine/threonine-protein kinase At4g35230 isoform X2 n=1 Tax=Eutrema salsugineum TaxID=72664 RepID=UPI000CED6AA6|nr:probable serine/threonine-protein kinase At4g35230 isoform X2 [Eutrema salsugineum]